jgi:hypothetical protein
MRSESRHRHLSIFRDLPLLLTAFSAHDEIALRAHTNLSTLISAWGRKQSSEKPEQMSASPQRVDDHGLSIRGAQFILAITDVRDTVGSRSILSWPGSEEGITMTIQRKHPDLVMRGGWGNKYERCGGRQERDSLAIPEMKCPQFGKMICRATRPEHF